MWNLSKENFGKIPDHMDSTEMNIVKIHQSMDWLKEKCKHLDCRDSAGAETTTDWSLILGVWVSYKYEQHQTAMFMIRCQTWHILLLVPSI